MIIILLFIVILATCPGFTRVQTDKKMFLYHNMHEVYSYIFLLNYSIYEKNRIKIFWVVLKIYVYLETDSGSGFILYHVMMIMKCTYGLQQDMLVLLNYPIKSVVYVQVNKVENKLDKFDSSV
jgi:hypothetical protein